MLKDLLTRAAHLATRTAQLRAALARVQAVNADAEAAVDALAGENAAYLRVLTQRSMTV